MWKRLFARAPVSAEEIEAMRAVLAKHGHLVRCLVVRSVQAFRIASPYCTNLQAFHCRFEPFEWQYTWRWYLDMTVAEAKQVNREITQFVLRLKSQLIALHLMAGLMDPQCIHDVMHAVGTASFHPHHHRLLLKRYRTRVCHWVHFDSPLSETDYLHVNTLLPMVETARFAIRDLSILAAPLETKHYHLQELDLQIQGFDHKILQNVRASFPNLRRLFVRAEDSGVGFDLIIDQGATMLYVGASIDPNEVASMIPLLPDLMVFDYHELNPACVAALAQHCSRLRFISTDRWVHRREGHDHPENHPTSVTPLLTSCPYLERVNTPTASIHMSDLVVDGQQENAASWVCTQLKYLNCQLVGIPTIESVEREVYESLIARTPEIHALHHQQIGEEETVKEMTRTMMLTGLEQDVLRKMLLRDRCRRILEKQLCLCPNATTWIEGFGAL
ncbi:hypothetical protein BGZ73_008446 [Actinomortierella ambigua]|nr:hypothetical protein BGZ73_008446 [Actinomortierella ambigua]